MDFFNRIKTYLGFPPNASQPNTNYNTQESNKELLKEHSHDRLRDDYETFGFNVFSNPVEMHRYFEHQMNEVLKNFGFFNENSQFGMQGDQFFSGRGDPFFFGENPFKNEVPALDDNHSLEENQEQELRDKYLKSGYEPTSPNEQAKLDKDLDGKFDVSNFDSVLRGRSSQIVPKTRVFGKSISSKTIRNSDGSYETHTTIRDHEGNEETTITRARGDKKYTITTKVNPRGESEVIEDMVNMDEHDKDSFIQKSDKKNLPPDWFPYDKFFK